jgi:hypothetical protein
MSSIVVSFRVAPVNYYLFIALSIFLFTYFLPSFVYFSHFFF